MTNESPSPQGAPRRVSAPCGAWISSALGTAVTALALLVMATMSGVSAVTGSASATTRAVTEAVMLIVLAVGVGLLSVNLLRRRSLAKTPTLLWHALLVPVGFSLMTGGAKVLGILTLVVAVATFVVTLRLPRYELDEQDADQVL